MSEILKMLISSGGRKFFVVIGAGIATTILCALKIVSGEVYATVTISIITVYVGGNVVQELRGKKPNEPTE